MGLDMYLKAERYISGIDWTSGQPALTPEYREVLRMLKLSEKKADTVVGFPSATVSVNVGYWRKANAIHAWFVKNVQKGVDDCKSYYVERDQLMRLAADCVIVLADKSKAMEILPPQDGFFFGCTDVDEGYMHDVDTTVAILSRVLSPDFKGYDFYYRSSW